MDRYIKVLNSYRSEDIADISYLSSIRCNDSTTLRFCKDRIEIVSGEGVKNITYGPIKDLSMNPLFKMQPSHAILTLDLGEEKLNINIDSVTEGINDLATIYGYVRKVSIVYR